MEYEIGCIRKDSRANFVITDDMIGVKSVYLEGEKVL
jgi:N-acetylglucosamine-6-phosphate deacetylase